MATKLKGKSKSIADPLDTVEGNAGSGGKKKKSPNPIADDDDFVEPPTKQQEAVVNSGNVGTAEMGDDDDESNEDDDGGFLQGFPTVGNRTCPKMMVEAIKLMNGAQQDAVREIGFGHILNLKVKKVPAAMGRWVLDNFDARSCELKLSDGRQLYLESVDATLMFGLPNGTRFVERKQKRKDCPLLVEWKAFFNNDSILPKQVKEKMLAEADGGKWFKIHFMVLLQVCLFENPGNGYVKPQILSNLADVSTIPSFDWGEYMLRCLVDSKFSWGKNNSILVDGKVGKGKRKPNLFCGPMLFLLGTYLDRVVLFRRTVQRSFPLINAWTYKGMRQRQKTEIESGGFGTGHLSARYEYALDVPEDGRSAAVIEPNVGSIPLVEPEKGAPVDDIRGFADKFISKAKLMVDTMVELMSMVEGVPGEFVNDVNVKQIISKAKVLLGCKATVSTENNCPDDSQPASTQQLEDAFWAQDGIPELLQKLEDAANKQFAFKKADDATNDELVMPGFSLGFTQEFGGNNLSDDVSGGFSKKKNGDPVVDVGTNKQGQLKKRANNGGKDIVDEQIQGSKKQRKELSSDVDKQTRPARIDEQMTTENDNLQQRQNKKGMKNKRKELPRDAEKLKGPAQNEEAMTTGNENEQGECQNKDHNATLEQTNDVSPVVGKLERVSQAEATSPNLVDNQKEQVVVRAGQHMMTRRNHADLKKSDKLNSPYVPRALSMTDKLSENEKKIAFWIMHNKEPNMGEIVFFTGAYELRREQMMSLLPTEFVVQSIIDIWSLILNHKEKSRSPGSRRRFFASTYLTAFSVVAPTKGWDFKKRAEFFFNRLSEEINASSACLFVDIDMFVFPIVHASHYYMVSFDLKNMKVELIDNSSAMDMSLLKEKYGEIPETLDKMLTLYLESRGRITAAVGLRSAEIVRLAMSWRDDINKEDCGIFLMRHMETYQGGGVKNWKSGLQKNNKKQMNVLRVKYCEAIVCSDINVFKDQVVKAALKHYQIARGEGVLNLAPILLNPKPKVG